MPVTDILKDLDAATLTVIADLDAGVERAWRLWADPRQLERWWGPPGYPATVVEHGVEPGDRVTYYMTGPGGERHHGWWRVVEADPPNGFAFEDGFADADGTPNDDLPTATVTVTLTPRGDGTRMTTVTRYASADALRQVLDMGMEEGIRGAMNQVDDLLAEGSPA